jgi:hypothetical protein
MEIQALAVAYMRLAVLYYIPNVRESSFLSKLKSFYSN